MKRLNKNIVGIITALLVLSGGTALGQRGQNKQMMGMKDAPGRHQQCQNMIPDLTEEQQNQIEEMRLDHMKEMMDVQNKLNEKRAELRTLQTKDNPDMEAIYSVIEEMGQVRTEMHKKRAKHHQEIRSLLNEEQKIYFDKHMMRMMNMKRGHNPKGMHRSDCRSPMSKGGRL